MPWERSSVFSLFTASNKFFLLPVFGLVVSLAWQSPSNKCSFQVTAPQKQPRFLVLATPPQLTDTFQEAMWAPPPVLQRSYTRMGAVEAGGSSVQNKRDLQQRLHLCRGVEACTSSSLELSAGDTRQEPAQTSLASAIPLFLAKILVWEEGKHTLKGTEPAWV